MTKSNLLKSTAMYLLVAAGVAGGCSSTKQVWVPDPDESVGSSGAGKAGSVSSAGESSIAGEPATEGGSSGVEDQAGDGGAFVDGGGGETGGIAGIGGIAGSSGTAGSGESSGNSGSGGTGGKAGAASGGSAGTSGSGGSAGKAGSGGSAGKAGSGGTSGGAAGSGGTAGGGASGSAGTGGAIALFTPASSSCTSGNVDSAFSVCRTCHSSSPTGGAPVGLVTFAQIIFEKDNIPTKLNDGLMPPPSSGLTISSTNKSRILDWITAGAIGVPYANGICP